MQFEHFFPLGIARSEAFIGREEQTDWLSHNVLSGVHTLLMAPRRYGKSSLALHALEKIAVPFVEIDLQFCRTAKSVEKKLIQGLQQLIMRLSQDPERLMKIAKNFFSQSRKSWKIGFRGFVELNIEPDAYDDVVDNILTIFEFVEQVLQVEKKRAVIFIDEVQEICHLEQSQELQGAIRHFAQRSEHLVFIFSGTNRRLLRQMFDNSTMPLYELCDKILLDKISEDTYREYLARVADLSWQQSLPEEVFTQIFALSERHPRRLYNLCLYVWRLCEHQGMPLNKQTVDQAWQLLFEANIRSIRYYLTQKNTSQLRVLALVATGKTQELTSKEAQRRTDLSSTAISKALALLEEEDLLEKDSNKHCTIVDPLIKATLSEYQVVLID